MTEQERIEDYSNTFRGKPSKLFKSGTLEQRALVLRGESYDFRLKLHELLTQPGIIIGGVMPEIEKVIFDIHINELLEEYKNGTVYKYIENHGHEIDIAKLYAELSRNKYNENFRKTIKSVIDKSFDKENLAKMKGYKSYGEMEAIEGKERKEGKKRDEEYPDEVDEGLGDFFKLILGAAIGQGIGIEEEIQQEQDESPELFVSQNFSVEHSTEEIVEILKKTDANTLSKVRNYIPMLEKIKPDIADKVGRAYTQVVGEYVERFRKFAEHNLIEEYMKKYGDIVHINDLQVGVKYLASTGEIPQQEETNLLWNLSGFGKPEKNKYGEMEKS